MPTAWIEVVDTSIKIGLGALLSGVAAISISRLNHRNSLEKEYVLKHRSILEDVTSEIEVATAALLRYWSAITDWSKAKESGEEIPDEKRALVTVCRKAIFEVFEGLSNSEGKLLLIGCTNQQEELRTYGETISEFYRYASRNNEEMCSSELIRRKSELLKMRKSLYESLNQAYRNAKM
ncbi:MAG: hypothetical protein OIF51_19200 [Cellvibrionaceae bacterium]|nr:hypothetical protein [Cellvibrionaceae bacterium]